MYQSIFFWKIQPKLTFLSSIWPKKKLLYRYTRTRTKKNVHEIFILFCRSVGPVGSKSKWPKIGRTKIPERIANGLFWTHKKVEYIASAPIKNIYSWCWAAKGLMLNTRSRLLMMCVGHQFFLCWRGKHKNIKTILNIEYDDDDGTEREWKNSTFYAEKFPWIEI